MTSNIHSHQGHHYDYDTKGGRFHSSSEIAERLEGNAPGIVDFPNNPNLKWDRENSGFIYERVDGRWLIVGKNNNKSHSPGSAEFEEQATWYDENSDEFRSNNAITNVHSYRDPGENHNYQYNTDDIGFTPTDEVNRSVLSNSVELPDGRRWDKNSGTIYENHDGRWNTIGYQKDSTKDPNDLANFYNGAEFLDKKTFFDTNGIKNDIQETRNGVDYGDGYTDGGFIDDYVPNSEVDEYVENNRQNFIEQSDGDYYDPKSGNWYTYDEDLGRWCIWANSKTENSPKTEYSDNTYDITNGIL